MRQTCKACLHERRAEIDQAIKEGIPYRTIAERFGLGIATIWRHKRHLEQGGTVAEHQAEQSGTERNKTEESHKQQGVTPAEQQAEQNGTRGNKAEQNGTRQRKAINSKGLHLRNSKRNKTEQGGTRRNRLAARTILARRFLEGL